MTLIDAAQVLGTPGPAGAGISSGQWSSLQGIVKSDTTGTILVKQTSGSALTVQKADGTNILNVDASGLFVSLYNGTDLIVSSDNGATVQFRVDGATGGIENHLKHKSSAPSIAVGTALGTGGSVGATVAGTDQAGTITLTAGTSALTTGVAATITFNVARPDTNYALLLTPSNANAGVNAVQYRISTKATGTWTIAFSVAPTSGQVYTYDYVLVEWTH